MTDVILDYDLERPTANELVMSLHQILGPEEARSAISRALRDLGLSATAPAEMCPADMLAFANILARQRGLVGVLARSFAIRLHTFEQLAARVQTEGSND